MAFWWCTCPGLQFWFHGRLTFASPEVGRPFWFEYDPKPFNWISGLCWLTCVKLLHNPCPRDDVCLTYRLVACNLLFWFGYLAILILSLHHNSVVFCYRITYYWPACLWGWETEIEKFGHLKHASQSVIFQNVGFFDETCIRWDNYSVYFSAYRSQIILTLQISWWSFLRCRFDDGSSPLSLLFTLLLSASSIWPYGPCL